MRKCAKRPLRAVAAAPSGAGRSMWLARYSFSVFIIY
jgi:hypothetical protein